MRTKRFSGIAALVLAFIMTAVCMCPAVFADADDAISVKDSAGNVFSENSVSITRTDKDFYWAGRTLNASKVRIGYDFLAAGETLSVSGGRIDCAARMAARNISMSSVKIGHNATLAAQSISMTDCSADSAILAAQDINLDGGRYNAARIYADKAIINCRVDGDVYVDVDKLEFGPNADIRGSVTGEVSAEPSMAKPAKIANLNVNIAPSDADDANDDAISDVFDFSGTIFSVLMLLVLWLVMRLCGDSLVPAASAQAAKTPGRIWALGFAVFFGAPIAMVVLMITVVGIPVSFIALMAYITMIMISTVFAGSAIGMWIAACKKPEMRKWTAGAIGTVAMWLLCKVPFIGWIVRLALLTFTMGAICLMLSKAIRRKDGNTPSTPSGPSVASGASDAEVVDVVEVIESAE